MERAFEASVTIVRGIVALVFLAAGTGKLVGAAPMVEMFAHFGFGPGFMRFIGTAEVAGAIGLFLPRVAPLAAAGLAIIMIGAIVQHVLHGMAAQAVPPVLFLASCGYLAYAKRGELAPAHRADL